MGKASRYAASALSGRHIQNMEEHEVYNCLDTLGKLPWPQSSKSEIWAALLEKLYKQLGETLTSIEGESKPPLNREKLMLLSILGSSTDVSNATAVALVQRYIEKNGIATSSEMGLEIRRVISATEVASLGSLLCGLTDYQWRGLITLDIFADTLVDRLANLDCAVTEPVKEHLS